MSCLSRARVDLASLPGAMWASQYAVYSARVMDLSTIRGWFLHSRSKRAASSSNLGLGCQALWRMDGLLLGLAAVALRVVTHGHHQQVAVSSFADACHLC